MSTGAAMYGTEEAYFKQWVEIASGDHVTVSFATQADRIQLSCSKCGLTLTAPRPEGTTVDYGVQEFVKLHAHTVSLSWNPQIDQASAKKIRDIQLETHEKYIIGFEKKIKLEMDEEKSQFVAVANSEKAAKLKHFQLEQLKWAQDQKEKKLQSGQNFVDSTGAAGVLVDGKKIYWKKDQKGNIVGVSDSPTAPVTPKRVPRETTGRKFR